MATFDTHEAVTTLKSAGFSNPQAEAVVETVGTAMGNSLVTKTDLELALQPVMTRADLDAALEPMASKADLELALQPMMTRADLDAALEPMASKADLELALQPIRADMVALEHRMTIKLGAMMVAGMSILAILQKVL